MPEIHAIREKAREGHSVAEISREIKVDEKTVRKYLIRTSRNPKGLKESL